MIFRLFPGAIPSAMNDYTWFVPIAGTEPLAYLTVVCTCERHA